MHRFLPISASEEPRHCGGHGDTGEREHDRHHWEVATDPRQQQSPDEADAREQERDRQDLPATSQRQQREAAQP